MLTCSEASLPAPSLISCVRFPDGKVSPSFPPLVSIAGASKDGPERWALRAGCRDRFEVPKFQLPNESPVRRAELPRSNLARSYQLQSSSGRQCGIKGGQGYLFTFFPPFWQKEIKANLLLCPAPPSSCPGLPKKTKRALKNPKFERGDLPSNLIIPGVTLR